MADYMSVTTHQGSVPVCQLYPAQLLQTKSSSEKCSTKKNVEPLGEKEVCLTVKLFEDLVTSNGSRGYSHSHNLAGSWISIAQMVHMWPYQRFSA